MKRVLLTLALGFVFAGSAAAAKFEINLDPAAVDNGIFAEFVREAGSVMSYRAYAPAEPLGLTGFDVGVSVSAVETDSEVWGAVLEDSSPDYLPVPRLQVRKGLPFNFDVGAMYVQVPSSDIKLFGGELQWALLEGSTVMPALAFRGHASVLLGVDDVDLTTYGADAVVSKGFALFTPYAGIGVVQIAGDYAGNDAVLEATLTSHDITEVRYFGGLQSALGLFRVTLDAEYMRRPTFTLKLSLGW